MSANIRIEGLDKAIRKCEKIGSLDIVKAGLVEAGKHVKDKAERYPPRKRISIHQVGGWKSEKQKRWFFAALMAGDITVPYRRTRALHRQWKMRQRKAGLVIEVRNDIPYGGFVQGEDQSAMHKAIGWKTTDQIAEQETSKVNEIVAKSIERALAKG